MDRVTKQQADELDKNDKFWFIPIRGEDFRYLCKYGTLRDVSGCIRAFNDIMDWYRDFRKEYGTAFVVIVSGVILRELGFKDCVFSDTPQGDYEKSSDDFDELRFYGEVQVSPDAYFILSPEVPKEHRIKIMRTDGGIWDD